jgi:hypothetical protein
MTCEILTFRIESRNAANETSTFIGFNLVQFLLRVHASFVKMNCVSKVMQFISIYAFGPFSFFAPEFLEAKLE